MFSVNSLNVKMYLLFTKKLIDFSKTAYKLTEFDFKLTKCNCLISLQTYYNK